MKSYFYKLSEVLMSVLLVMACNKENTDTPSHGGDASEDVASVSFVISGFVEEGQMSEDNRTKTELNSNGLVWCKGDSVGIFSSKGGYISVDLSSYAGSSSAELSGKGRNFKTSESYCSYYPSNGDSGIAKNSIPIEYSSEVTQVGNNSTLHLGANAYMFAAESSVDSEKLTLRYWQLGSALNFRVSLPAGTYTKLVLSSENPVFITDGNYDLSTAKDNKSSTSDIVSVPVIKSGHLTDKLTINLQDVTFTEKSELSAYIMAAPVDVSNKPLTVTVYSGDFPRYTYKYKRATGFLAQILYNIKPDETGVESMASSSESVNDALASGETSISIVGIPENTELNIELPSAEEAISITVPADEPKCTMNISYSETSGSAPAKLEIQASNGSDLSLDTPETTVTLGGSNYGYVRSRTASNTLVIKEGVIVETLCLVKGNVEVYGEVMSLNTDYLEEGESPTVSIGGTVHCPVNDNRVSVNYFTVITESMVECNAPMEFVSSGQDCSVGNEHCYGLDGSPDWFSPLAEDMAAARKAYLTAPRYMWDGNIATCFHTNTDWGVPSTSWGCRDEEINYGQHFIQIDFETPLSNLDIWVTACNEEKNINAFWSDDVKLIVKYSHDGSTFAVSGENLWSGSGKEIKCRINKGINNTAYSQNVKALRFQISAEDGWTHTETAFGIAELSIAGISCEHPSPGGIENVGYEDWN